MKSIFTVVGVLLLTGVTAQADYEDSQGRIWRKMDAVSLNVSVAQMRTVCAQDPCSGSLNGVNLSGYTWADADDVIELMQEFDAQAPIAGAAQFFTAGSFIGALGRTYSSNFNYFMSEGNSGVTSSVDENGRAVAANVGRQHRMVSASGNFSIGSLGSDTSAGQSAYLYKRKVAAPEPKNCDLDGVTHLAGTSLLRYQAASVAFGSSCISENRVCNGETGLFSGSYNELSCSVQAAPPPPVVDCSKIKDKKKRRRCEASQR